jgi:integrase
MARRAKRGFATVVQEKSGRYSVRYTGPGGIRMSAGKTFPRKADAEAWAADKRRAIDKGARAQLQRVTFDEYAQQWLEQRHVNGHPIRPRTREHYEALLSDHILPTFGGRVLAAITPQDVKDWHAVTLTSKPTMRSHAYGLLHAIMASAFNDELVDANPCRIPGAGNAKRVKKIKVASVDELSIITEAMPERLSLMVLLASWCALRFGETVELRRGDVDLSAELIRVRRGAVRVNGVYEIGDTKTEAGVRDVDVPPHLIPVIEQHLEKFVSAERDALLFPNETGGHMQPSTFARHWYKARKSAGRDDLRFHDLRHTGATMAAITGATLGELMARLGHSSPAAAIRYQHAAQSRGREIAALLSKLAGK